MNATYGYEIRSNPVKERDSLLQALKSLPEDIVPNKADVLVEKKEAVDASVGHVTWFK